MVTNETLDDEIDVLFQLPVAEFTGARNDLVARLKKSGRTVDASRVKALAKPSISAWAVNQLYWQQRDTFEQLLETGQRIRQAQTSGAGKLAGLRASLDARRELLSELSYLASQLLNEAGHNSTPDTLHRITTTLEALSAHASLADGPTLGRLSQDVDPPGFDSLAAFKPHTDKPVLETEVTKFVPSRKPVSATTKTTQKSAPAGNTQKVRALEDRRREKIAAAKASLQQARKSLSEARARAQRLGAVQEKAAAEAKASDSKKKQAEKQLRKAEEQFKKLSAAFETAVKRADAVTAEAMEAAEAVNEAEQALERAAEELELLV